MALFQIAEYIAAIFDKSALIYFLVRIASSLLEFLILDFEGHSNIYWSRVHGIGLALAIGHTKYVLTFGRLWKIHNGFKNQYIEKIKTQRIHFRKIRIIPGFLVPSYRGWSEITDLRIPEFYKVTQKSAFLWIYFQFKTAKFLADSGKLNFLKFT